MNLPPFRIEKYYERHEFTARFMLSSSDAESWTIGELLALEPDAQELFLSFRCGYTESPGTPYVRGAVAGIYEGREPDEVVVCSCAEEGVFLAYHALLGPGDHAIVEAPCYESALVLARSTGAEVDSWSRRFEDGWAHDVEALTSLIRPKTRLIYINSPHNPTGLSMPRDVFDAVVEIARDRRIVLFSDEVYRGLEHDPAMRLPAVCDVYERGLSLGSMSKSYGLPGLRIGWIASQDPVILRRLIDLKMYTTICSSGPSEFLTALALRNGQRLIERNHAITLANMPLVEALISRHPDLFEWIRPNAGPIGFPRVCGIGDVTEWCERVVRESGVLLLPGSVYDQPNHVRLGFGRKNAPDALAEFEQWMNRQ